MLSLTTMKQHSPVFCTVIASTVEFDKSMYADGCSKVDGQGHEDHATQAHSTSPAPRSTLRPGTSLRACRTKTGARLHLTRSTHSLPHATCTVTPRIQPGRTRGAPVGRTRGPARLQGPALDRATRLPVATRCFVTACAIAAGMHSTVRAGVAVAGTCCDQVRSRCCVCPGWMTRG